MRSIPMTLLLAGASGFPAVPAASHQAPAGWQYDQFCCNGDGHSGDCQMISTKNVRITEHGYEISLAPGDHRLVTRPHRFTLPHAKARRSGDAEYHLCLYSTEDTLRCFYAPVMAF